MTERALRELAGVTNRVCLLLWVLRSAEPEILELIERHHSQGYVHYLTSRLGLLPESRWAAVVRIVPPSLVEHLLPRCRELGPSGYVQEALAAASAALGRRHPDPLPPGMERLAHGEVQGELGAAFAALPRTGDRQLDFLLDSMALREERSHLHFQAGEEAGWSDLDLMLVTAAWQGRSPLKVAAQFRWPDDAAQSALEGLAARGLMDLEGGLTAQGREERDRLERETDLRVAAALAGRGVTDASDLISQVATVLQES
ncbi:MAG: helix-turn-helix domain-containing protein [Candidatus Dormibacteria bacterium]